MDGNRPAPRALLGLLIIIITVQVGGFALLWSKDSPPPEYVYLPATTDKTSTASPTTASVVVVSPPDEKALRGIIQAVLQQELASYAHRLTAAPEAMQKTISADRPGVMENSPQNIQALNEAKSTVQAAISRGAWTDEDNMSLFSVTSDLSREQRHRIMDEIGNAINRQELEIKAPPPAL